MVRRVGAVAAMRRDLAVIVCRPSVQGNENLMLAVGAHGDLGGLARTFDRGQQQRDD